MNSPVNILKVEDISEIEELCLSNGYLIPVPYDKLKKFSTNQISLFCHKHAFYTLPTTELIEWLRGEIRGMNAIEVGSGNGSIGRALSITKTDNKSQEWKVIKYFYDCLKQPTITYPSDVTTMDAEQAVHTFKPDVIVASWLTSKYDDTIKVGNIYGPDERSFTVAQKYIHIGNELVHSRKPLLGIAPVTRYNFPWLVTRSTSPMTNVIYVFDFTQFRNYEGQ